MSDTHRMTDNPWLLALHVDPGRRDREGALADAVKAGMAGGLPPFDRLGDPVLLRRAGYLLDLAQHLRGQTAEEGARLADLRAMARQMLPCTFWPDEPPLPAGTDPLAERWNYVRGPNLRRLLAALRRPPTLLPPEAEG